MNCERTEIIGFYLQYVSINWTLTSTIMGVFNDYLKLINNCDPQDPLLSSTPLGQRLNGIPLNHVEISDMRDLTQALNLEQLIPTKEGLARDYRGLGELLGFSKIEIETRFKQSSNQTRSMLDATINKNLDNKRRCHFSLTDLLKKLEKIERFDVIDDFLPTMVRLANETQDNRQYALQPVASNLVRDKQYDAFICYAPEDYLYAKELIDFLENNGKSIARADDLPPGNFENDAVLGLIDSGCRKVIVILTPNFSRSKECEAQVKFASERGIRSDHPRIIPVKYEACDYSELPRMIQVMSKIDLTNPSGSDRHWQMRRLINSLDQDDVRPIQAPMIINNIPINMIDESSIPPRITCSNEIQSSMNDSYEPIVDLLHSESSVSIGSGYETNSYPDIARSLTPSSSISNYSTRFIGTIRKLFLSRQTTVPPSTSSQAMLITTTSSNHSDDRLNGKNV